MTSIDMFDNSNRNQINIAIVGAVSAGKSTLLNTIFAKTYSHCKKKRTTMTPQIYYEYDSKSKGKISKLIKKENRVINETLIKKTEAEELLTMDDIKELIHIVPKIYQLTKLEKDIYLSLYDIPGLNDARTKSLYFNYLETNFYKFDIILFVIDINSGLNTSDEIEILTKIIENCKRNYETHGVHNKLIIIANKCDEMSYIEGKLQLEEEFQEMYEQINTQVNQSINDIFPTLEFDILPLSSEDSYIYRILDQDPDAELDIKYVNKFGNMEYGRTRWNKLTEPKKISKMKNLMKEWDIKSSLNLTGFNGFRDKFNTYLSPQNQKIFVHNHLIYELKQIKDNHKVDITNDIQEFYKYYQKYKDLDKSIKIKFSAYENFKDPSIKTTNNVTNIFVEHLTLFLSGYKSKVLDGFINIVDEPKSYKIKDEAFIPQIEESKTIIDNMIRLFNGDCPIIKEISVMINNTLQLYYNQEINNKSKPLKTVYNYIMNLLGFDIKPSTINIDNFFDNPNIMQNDAESIISYIEKFEENNLINIESKIDKVLEVLIKIYKSINGLRVLPGTGPIEYMKFENYPSYMYYTDKFWTKFIMFNDDYDSRIEELGFISKVNATSLDDRYVNKLNKHFNKDKTSLLILENYFLDIYSDYISYNMKSCITQGKELSKVVMMVEEEDGSDDDMANAIDNELGLNN